MKSSMQDDLRKFLKMERNKTVVFLDSKLNLFEKKINDALTSILVVSLLMAIIATSLSFKKMEIFLIGAIPFLCFFVIFAIVVTFSILIEEFSGKEMLKQKISRQMYKGSLHEIFNMDCTITRNVLSENKKYIADNIFKYKGLSGKIILELLNQINLDISLASQKQNVKEETDALVAAKTTIGKMIEEVNEISAA